MGEGDGGGAFGGGRRGGLDALVEGGKVGVFGEAGLVCAHVFVEGALEFGFLERFVAGGRADGLAWRARAGAIRWMDGRFTYSFRPTCSASPWRSLLRCFCSHEEGADMFGIARCWIAWRRRSQWLYLERESETMVARAMGGSSNVYVRGWGVYLLAEGLRVQASS